MMKKIILLCWFLVLSAWVHADRLKDLTSISGVSSNPLVGYGLVVGLDGTGDKTAQTPFTAQSFRSMLKQFGITIPPGAKFQLKNVAAVTVHAKLPAFAKPGQRIDVTVSSIGNAKSLRGGSLLMTPLKAANGQVYALAQGDLVVGGFGAEGLDGSRVTVNVPSVGRIPNGANIERAVANNFNQTPYITFNLNEADFTTSKRVAEAINNKFGPDVATSIDASSIQVTAPSNPNQRVAFMAMLENMEVKPGDAPARVVINSRTGTIVVGKHVRVEPVAVTHGSLVVTVSEDNQISQPNALGGGTTTMAPQTNDINVEQRSNTMFAFKGSTTLDEVVRAINQVGAAPGDLMAILEAMKQAGALRADLIII